MRAVRAAHRDEGEIEGLPVRGLGPPSFSNQSSLTEGLCRTEPLRGVHPWGRCTLWGSCIRIITAAAPCGGVPIIMLACLGVLARQGGGGLGGPGSRQGRGARVQQGGG